MNGADRYARKRVDPRWQEMRLRVFNRDCWACRCCGRADLEFHAHHSYYEHDREPWDYPMDSIVTYCHNCHEAEHGRSFAGDAAVLQLLRQAGFPLVEDRLALAGAFLGVGCPLGETEAREIAFIIGVLAWSRGPLWNQVLELCNDFERAQPRYGDPSTCSLLQKSATA
jgi:hypothetical protein